MRLRGGNRYAFRTPSLPPPVSLSSFLPVPMNIGAQAGILYLGYCILFLTHFLTYSLTHFYPSLDACFRRHDRYGWYPVSFLFQSKVYGLTRQPVAVGSRQVSGETSYVSRLPSLHIIYPPPSFLRKQESTYYSTLLKKTKTSGYHLIGYWFNLPTFEPTYSLQSNVYDPHYPFPRYPLLSTRYW